MKDYIENIQVEQVKINISELRNCTRNKNEHVT